MWFIRPTLSIAEISIHHDLHTHLLPNRDDGFACSADALDALKLMHDQGLEHVALTPHIESERYPLNTKANLTEAFEAFKQLIPADWNLRLTLAAEYMCDNAFQSTPTLLCFKDKSILIEMSYFFPSPNLKQALFDLCTDGYKPILAHPERYSYYAHALDDFEVLQQMGCRFQLNLLSLGGVYGRASVKILNYLIKNHLYSFVGSDIHSVTQWEKIRGTHITRTQAALLEELLSNNAQLL